MIPADWKYAELQDVAPVIDCKHKTPRYSLQGVPIISPGNLAWGALKFEGCRTISENDYAEMMDHCTVAIGDVVFGRNQSVGVSSIVIDNQPFALGQDTVLIQPRAINPSFLHQWLQSKQFSLSILRLQGRQYLWADQPEGLTNFTSNSSTGERSSADCRYSVHMGSRHRYGGSPDRQRDCPEKVAYAIPYHRQKTPAGVFRGLARNTN